MEKRYFDCPVVFIYVLHLKYMLESRINTLVDCLELSIDVVIAGRGMLPVLILEKVNIKLQECITTDFNFKIEVSSLCLN